MVEATKFYKCLVKRHFSTFHITVRPTCVIQDRKCEYKNWPCAFLYFHFMASVRCFGRNTSLY